MNRTINNMLEKFVSENQLDWDELLPALVWSCTTSKHSATGYSPFELNHGFAATLSWSRNRIAAAVLVSRSSASGMG